MRKVFVFFVVVFVFFSFCAFAAEKKVTKNVQKAMVDDVDWAEVNQFISTNPLALAFGGLNGHYEFNLSKEAGFGIDASLIFWGAGDWSTFGFSVGPEYNFYFQKHAPNGWFAGALGGIMMLSAKYLGETASSFGFYLGGHGGYRWIWDSGFLVDVQLLLQYSLMNLSVAGTNIPYGGFGVGPGVSIGYAWK